MYMCVLYRPIQNAILTFQALDKKRFQSIHFYNPQQPKIVLQLIITQLLLTGQKS